MDLLGQGEERVRGGKNLMGDVRHGIGEEQRPGDTLRTMGNPTQEPRRIQHPPGPCVRIEWIEAPSIVLQIGQHDDQDIVLAEPPSFRQSRARLGVMEPHRRHPGTRSFKCCTRSDPPE